MVRLTILQINKSKRHIPTKGNPYIIKNSAPEYRGMVIKDFYHPDTAN